MCGRKNHKEKTNEEERRITKKSLLPERMWIQDWTIVQCDGSFHTVTKASDNRTSESHVAEVYTPIHSRILERKRKAKQQRAEERQKRKNTKTQERENQNKTEKKRKSEGNSKKEEVMQERERKRKSKKKQERRRQGKKEKVKERQK